jgi:hypothetical protein
METSRRRILALPFALFAGPLVRLVGEAQTKPGTSAVSSGNPFGLTIPKTHPRLWWTPDRLAKARSSFGVDARPIRRDDLTGHAFRYLMSGDKNDARTAINAALALKLDVSRTSSNEARWFGEAAILIFDWAHDQFTPAERTAFIERWNGYLAALAKKQWGGTEMPQSNYFWGYFRNELEWGIATYHENPEAHTILEHALNVRWKGAFMPHANTEARGGLPLEGSQYGRYQLQYACVPLVTANLLGRPMHQETDFFRDAVYWLAYATTPSRTVSKNGGDAKWEVFPMGDDQFFQHGGSAEGPDYATFASTAAELWRGKTAGDVARRWLKMTGLPRPNFIAAVETPSTGTPTINLPLDYYAAGPQHLFARTSWESDALVVHLQFGSGSGRPHEHADHGNWQMWRGGRWLSRETTGYSLETYMTPAHNGILLNGKGIADGDRNGTSVVKRLASHEFYAYAAVDLSPSYRNDQTPKRNHRERDNPVAGQVEREFLFVRPLETLVIFDRVQANSAVMPAAAVKKAFLAHFEQPPVVKGPGEVLGHNGNQTLRLLTLAPANATRKVVFEGDPIGQHRVEIESSGNDRTFFLHVAQARGKDDPDVVTKVTETAGAFEVTLEHPKHGAARVSFPKASTAPAACSYSRTGLPAAAAPLLNRVQQFKVTDAGPEWERLGKENA